MSQTADTQREKVRELLSGIRLAMLTSVATDGSLHSRPMALQENDSEDELWFIADLESDKAHEIQHDQHVNVSFVKSDDRWVSVTGTARIVRDQAKLQQLWNPFVKAWFPNGPDDPRVGLLQVTMHTVDYWEAHSPKPLRALQQLKAAATGGTPDMGESGTLELKPN